MQSSLVTSLIKILLSRIFCQENAIVEISGFRSTIFPQKNRDFFLVAKKNKKKNFNRYTCTTLLLQANAARFWTYLTGLLVSEEDLSVDIPDADPFFGKYGPSFELTLTPGRRPNLNSSEILNDLLEEAFSK